MIIRNSNVRQKLFQSRYAILGGLVAIILAIMILYNLNGAMAQERKEKNNQIMEQSKNKVENMYNPGDTLIEGASIPKEKQKENEKLVDEFFQYCNTRQIEKAYNLLTKDCQEALYPTLKRFEERYVNEYFKTAKIYNMQSWVNDKATTYQVKILEDVLSTGKLDSTKTIEDYYTIVKEGDKLLLSINGYIKKETINKEATKNNITIVVESKDIYKEYEICHFKIINNTDNTILMDTKTIDKSVYESSNLGTKFSGYTYESDEFFLTVEAGKEKRLDLKFSKMYNPTVWIQSITFSDIIRNKEEYKNAINKEEYERLEITVKI